MGGRQGVIPDVATRGKDRPRRLIYRSFRAPATLLTREGRDRLGNAARCAVAMAGGKGGTTTL